jgi:hypothetical protein
MSSWDVGTSDLPEWDTGEVGSDSARAMHQYSLLKVLFPFSLNLSFTGFPDSILTVLVITRLATSKTGPLHPATVTGRKAHNGRPFVRAAGRGRDQGRDRDRDPSPLR